MRTRLHRPRMQMRITRQISAALATHPAQGVNQYLQPDILLIIDCKNTCPLLYAVRTSQVMDLLLLSCFPRAAPPRPPPRPPAHPPARGRRRRSRLLAGGTAGRSGTGGRGTAECRGRPRGWRGGPGRGGSGPAPPARSPPGRSGATPPTAPGPSADTAPARAAWPGAPTT